MMTLAPSFVRTTCNPGECCSKTVVDSSARDARGIYSTEGATGEAS